MQIAESVDPSPGRIRLGNRGLVVPSWRFRQSGEPGRSTVIPTGSISEWLEACGLGQFVALFEENEVDLPTLQLLTESDLKEIGLPFGPRKRILNLINDERGQEKSGSVEPLARAPVGERRQLTTLFCDMVGFTDLAQKLDLETLQVVVRAYEDTCANCIVRYDGYVFTLLGDGVVAFFGFPLAHENEAERAVRAGLDIVEAMARLQFPEMGKLQVRIGIATGMVVVATGERNAVGQTMNLASRLQAAAQPGMVVVGERTRRLAGGQFEYEDLGERELKGVSGFTRLYRVLGVSTAESRFEASTHRGVTLTVGRKKELGALLELWRQVKETGSGRAALVSGDAGIGKSRIVSALRERLKKQPMKTLLLQCLPFFVNSAFYPVRSWLERTLGLDRNEDAASRLAKLEEFFLKRWGLPKADLPFVAAILSIPFHERYGPISIAPKLAKEATMRVLVEIVRTEARARPILILFEDAHWADPSTLDWLGRLADQLAEATALLVVTARPEFASAWNERHDVVAIDLGKLSPSQSAALVDELAGGKALPPGLADQIVARADGVPLFLQELTKTILESGDLVADGDRFAYAGSSARITIPETLRDSLTARLDRVPESKEIAQIGSVIGREFSYELIAGLDLNTEDKLEEPLRLLTASGLATSHGEIPDAVYTFSHALVQDAAYNSLLKTRRKQLHGDVARLLEQRWRDTPKSAPELLAHHYTAAEHYDLAAPLWLKAGEIAIQRFALPEAISHLRAGMSATSRLPPSRDRDQMELSLRTALGPALVAQQGWGHGEVSQTLEPAWRLAQALNQRAAYLPILNALSLHYMCIDRLAEALRWADTLLKSGAENDDDGLEIVGHRIASACHYWRGDFIAARRSGDRVHELYDRERHWGLALLTNNDPFTGEGVYRPQYLWMMGHPDQALKALYATEANARRRGHPFDLGLALTLGAQLFDFLGDSIALLRRADEAERIGDEHGVALLGQIMAEISRGVGWLREGRVADSVAQLDQGVARLTLTGHRIWIWYLRALQAEGVALTGNLDRARSLIEESVARMEAGEERSHYAETLRLRGWILIIQGERENAEASLRQAIAVARGQQAKSWELRASKTLARLLADCGRRGDALALLRPIHDWFTEGFDTKDLKESRQLIFELGNPAYA